MTFAISWGGILGLLASGLVSPDAEHLALLLGLGYVGMLGGPSIAALVLRRALDGRPGLRAMRSEVLAWRVGIRWWMVALFTAPLSILAVLLSFSLVSPEFVPRLVAEGDRGALLRFVAVTAIVTGVFEELGWTGFATRVLLDRHGVVRTGVVLGLITAAWNLLIVYLKELSVPTPGGVPLPVFLVVSLVTWQTAYRVLMVFTYDRTRSVLLAMVMQTSLVAFWTSLTPTGLTQTGVMLFYVALTGLWSVVAIVALRVRSREQRTDHGLRASTATAVRP